MGQRRVSAKKPCYSFVSFEYNKKTMKEPPYYKIPASAVPKPSYKKHDHKVAVYFDITNPIPPLKGCIRNP